MGHGDIPDSTVFIEDEEDQNPANLREAAQELLEEANEIRNRTEETATKFEKEADELLSLAKKITEACNLCDGTGSIMGDFCPRCKGTGRYLWQDGEGPPASYDTRCSTCNGTGRK